MAYTKTNWVDGTTPVNAVNLNKIETEVQALDSLLGGIGPDILLNGDMYVYGSDLYLGNPGNDVHLFRAGINLLQIDGSLQLKGGSGQFFSIFKSAADNWWVFTINQLNGKHSWGPGGSTAPDTNLYRSAAGILKTDGRLDVAAGMLLTNPGAPGNVIVQTASG